MMFVAYGEKTKHQNVLFYRSLVMTSFGMPQIWFGLSVLAIARHVKVQQIQKTLGDAAKQLATLRPGRHHQHLPRAAEV
jgi:hypothetical protein